MIPGQLPGTDGCGLLVIPPLQAVVFVEITRRAQRLVIKTDIAQQRLYFFTERMDSLQLARRCGQLVLGAFNELLIAAIEQPSHFAAHQDAFNTVIALGEAPAPFAKTACFGAVCVAQRPGSCVPYPMQKPAGPTGIPASMAPELKG